MKSTTFEQTMNKTWCPFISIHTDFVVHAILAIFWQNSSVMVCFYINMPDFPKNTFPKKRTHYFVALKSLLSI